MPDGRMAGLKVRVGARTRAKLGEHSHTKTRLALEEGPRRRRGNPYAVPGTDEGPGGRRSGPVRLRLVVTLVRGHKSLLAVSIP